MPDISALDKANIM